MLNAAHLLGVPNDYRFLWVCRALLVLPLPPLWSSEGENMNRVYYSPDSNIPVVVHPATPFLKALIRSLRSDSSLKANYLMEFHDDRFIRYQIDLRKFSRN